MSFKKLKLKFRPFIEAYQKFTNDRCQLLSAAITYYGVFSLGPILLLISAILGQILDPQTVQNLISNHLDIYLGEAPQKAIETLLSSASLQLKGSIGLSIGLLVLLFSASRLFKQLQESFDQIWKVPPLKGKQKFYRALKKQGVAIASVFTLMLVLFLTFISSTVIRILVGFFQAYLPLLDVALLYSDFVISLVSLTLFLAIAYKMLPRTKVAWKSAWPAALITSIGLVANKSIMSLLIAKSGILSLYGVFVSLIIFMIWLNLSSQLFFYGAEMSYVLERRRSQG